MADSGSEDSGSASGWNIHDASVFRTAIRSLAIQPTVKPLVIGVKGQTVDALVSNIGQTQESTADFSDGASQVFRSGGNYTVTSIEIDSADAAGDDFDVSLWTVGSGLPRGKRDSFTRPDSFTAGTLVFTAPRNTRISGPLWRLRSRDRGGRRRTGDAPDDYLRQRGLRGQASRFSIADTHGTRSGSTWSLSSGGASIKIRVNGFAGHPPAPPGAVGAAYIGEGKVRVEWTASNSGTTTISGYRVEFSTDAGASWSDAAPNIGSTSTSYTHTHSRPPPYDDVRYRVSAISALGMSIPRAIGSVETGPIALVSNTGQSHDHRSEPPPPSVSARSQAFRTGGSRFTLTGIEVAKSGTASNDFTASLWTVRLERPALIETVRLHARGQLLGRSDRVLDTLVY